MILECPICQKINKHHSIMSLNINERMKVYYFKCILCDFGYSITEKLPEIKMETK